MHQYKGFQRKAGNTRFEEPLKFYKMSGSGNDFVIIDHRQPFIPDDTLPDFVRKVCARRLGVGADGLILVESSKKADFRWRFFNSDGGEVEMCGNGSRCVARFAQLIGVVNRADTSFETLAGVIHAHVAGDVVKVQLTKPAGLELNKEIIVSDQRLSYHFINTGVPHVVVSVEDVEAVDVVGVGREIRYHTAFQPAGTNANFVQFLDTKHILVRTYERGVEDETLACGTGAVASVLIGGALGKLVSPVEVKTRGGEVLKIYFDGNSAESRLEGRVKVIYEGYLWDEIWVNAKGV